jgi:hypothetical protein
MTDTYKDFQREPSRAHQCMHESENDGTRCRAMAMQNNYMCYAHRTDDVPTVIENDMFLIDSLDTHEAIQKTFCDVAARLACNHIDLKRAELLITLLRAASRNLRDAATARRQAAREAAAEAKAAAAAGAPGSTASSSTLGLNPADPLPNCHPERSSDPLQNCHPERSSASAPNAVEEPVLSLSKEPAVACLPNCHPERSSASAPNAVEEPVLSLSKEPAVACLQNCHPERSSASAPNAVEGPAVASPTAPTPPRTSPKPPKRIYTDEEKNFLKWTTCSTHYAPVHRPRPESITDDDIIAAINAKRRICSLGPIETDPTWNRATLSTGPVHPPASRYPEASASGLSPAAQEEGALAPGVSNSRTLPTVQAVACPTYH